MNTNIDIEALFLQKEYHELSEDEKLAIKDIASDESSFNDTKLMMSSIQNYLNEIPEISPKKESKEILLDTFKKVRPAATEKTVGLGFFFPKDKSFFQKPGFQILAAAAVLVFIITIFNTTIFTKDESKIAQNEMVKEEGEHKNSAEHKNSNTNEIDEVEETSNENESSEIISTTEKKNEKDNSIIVKEESIAQGASSEKTKVSAEYFMEDATGKSDFAVFDDELAVAPSISEEIDVLENTVEEDVVDNSTSTMIFSGNVPASNATSAMVSEEYETKTTAVMDLNKKRVSSLKTPKLSKPLSENAELINLFYTAM